VDEDDVGRRLVAAGDPLPDDGAVVDDDLEVEAGNADTRVARSATPRRCRAGGDGT
jgi:hypothetical protein